LNVILTTSKAARRGFTLIELLVVIAIIAILAAILFPVFAKVREKARQTACASNMKQLGLAIIQYKEDYDEVYPGAWKQYNTTLRTEWEEMIYPYVKSAQVYDCPDQTTTASNDSTQSCVSNPDTCKTTTTYSYNAVAYYGADTGTTLENIGVPEPGNSDEYGATDAVLTEPTNTILLTEANFSHGGQDNTWTGNETDFNGNDYAGNPWLGSATTASNVNELHTNGLNVLWYDGHVKWARNTLDVTTTYPNGGPYYWYLVKPTTP